MGVENKQKVLGIVFILFLSVLPRINAVEIVLEKEFGEPNTNGFRAGYSNAFWIDHDEILISRYPLRWVVDIAEGVFSGFSEIDIDPEFHITFSAVENNDGAVFFYGKVGPFEDRYYGYYSISTGWVTIEQDDYHTLKLVPPKESHKIEGTGIFDWKQNLYGDYSLVPRPVYNYDFTGISISSQNDEISIPVEFQEFYNIGNMTMTSIRFDRMRIAVIANHLKRTAEDEGYESGWPIFLLKVIYDGHPHEQSILYSEPSWEAEEIGTLPDNIALKISDTANYTVLESGIEDFWYYVESDIGNGWIFGGDLIMEGENWEDRLNDRGAPLDINEYLQSKEELSEEPANEEQMNENDLPMDSETLQEASVETESIPETRIIESSLPPEKKSFKIGV